jgi:Sec-independent protein translocase protein TatA
MFDIGLTEIIVTGMVACVVLDTKDIPKIFKTVKQFFNYLSNITNEIKNLFIEIEQETKTIIDLDGNKQLTYDLDDIKPDIKHERKK